MPTQREWVRRETAALERASQTYHDKVICALAFVAAFENVLRPTVGVGNIQFAFGYPVSVSPSQTVTPDIVILLQEHIFIAEICYARSRDEIFDKQIDGHIRKLSTYAKIEPTHFGMPSRNYSKGIALIVPDERAEDAVALADERFGSDMKGAILGHLFDGEPKKSVCRLHKGITGHRLLDRVLAKQHSISLPLPELEGNKEYGEVTLLDETPPDNYLLTCIWPHIYRPALEMAKMSGQTGSPRAKVRIPVKEVRDNLWTFCCIPPIYRLGVRRPPFKERAVRKGLRLLQELGLGALDEDEDEFELKVVKRNPMFTRKLGQLSGKRKRRKEDELKKKVASLRGDEKRTSQTLEKELKREGKTEVIYKGVKKLSAEQHLIYPGKSMKIKALRKQLNNLTEEIEKAEKELEDLRR